MKSVGKVGDRVSVLHRTHNTARIGPLTYRPTPLIRFSHFNRYHDKRKTTFRTVFSHFAFNEKCEIEFHVPFSVGTYSSLKTKNQSFSIFSAHFSCEK